MAFKKKAFGNRGFWNRLGINARTMFQNEIFDDGKNVYGGKWLNGKYSKDYATEKAKGTGKRQAKAYATQVTPVFTSDTLKDLEEFLDVSKNGFKFGFPTRGGIVKSLRKRFGKSGTITSKDKPVPDKVSRYIAKSYHDWVRKNQKSQTRTHGKGGAKTK